MNKSFVICIILILSALSISVTYAETDNLDNSTISVTEAVTAGNTTQLIDVYAEALNGTSVSGVEVFLTTTDGKFDNSTGVLASLQNDGRVLTGFTNNSGYLTVNWTSPSIFFDTPGGQILVFMNASLSIDAVVLEISTSIQVQDSSDAIAGSEIIVQESIRSNETIPIQVLAKSNVDVPKVDAQVDISIPQGEFITSNIGQTDNLGNFSVLWHAPALTIETPSISLEIIAVVELSDTIDIILSETIVISLYENVSSISSTLLGTTQLTENSTTELTLLVADQDASPLEQVEIYMTVSNGFINGNNTEFIGNSSNTGEFVFDYSSPVLSSNNSLNVTFGVTLNYGNISSFDSHYRIIEPVLDTMKITLEYPEEPISQGTRAQIVIQVTSNTTGEAINEVDVAISTDLGVWVETSDPSLSLQTNSSGQAVGILNLENVNLFYAIQALTLEINAYQPKYYDYSSLQPINVLRTSQMVDLGVIVSELSTTPDGTVDISPFVSINNVGVSNVSVQLVASAGFFSNNELSIIDTTGENGLYTTVWQLGETTLTQTETKILISAIILTPDFVSDVLTFNLTIVDPSISQDGGFTTGLDTEISISGGSENNGLVLSVVAGLAILVGSSSAVFIRRRRS